MVLSHGYSYFCHYMAASGIICWGIGVTTQGGPVMECGLMFAWLESAQMPPEIYREFHRNAYPPWSAADGLAGNRGDMYNLSMWFFYTDCCPCI